MIRSGGGANKVRGYNLAMRWIPRALVVLTALICLGVGGYAGQGWWARKIANDHAPFFYCEGAGGRGVNAHAHHSGIHLDLLRSWRGCPWYGERGWFSDSNGKVWIPRRYYRESLIVLTLQDLGNDPTAWETWFNAHPNLVWDEDQERLVDRPAR